MTRRFAMRRRWVAAGAIGVVVGAHLLAIGREAVNWDEFAIFWRAAALLRTGQLLGGGRPGVAEILLVPFVRGCTDSLAAVLRARWLWSAFTFAAAAAFYGILSRMRAGRSGRAAGALLGVGLWALVPAVMRWSIQVRTDQGMLAFGLAGGWALLASRQRRWLAFLAGCGFGLGFLFTQKLVYVVFLLLILVVADSLGREGADARAEAAPLLVRLALCAVGGSAVIALYRYGLPAWVRLPSGPMLPVGGGLNAFEHYRSVFGFVAYRAMVPTLAAHLILAALLVARTLRAAVKDTWSRDLVLAWTILLAGAVVGSFHAGAFPYFWMTLGLFPAAALAVVWEEIVDAVPAEARTVVIAGVVAVLVVPAAVFAKRLLQDSQQVQRRSFEFIARNFAPESAGYQIEGALFCRPDPDPFPVLFREHLERNFTGSQARQNIDAFIARFRDHDVSFFVYSHMIPFFPKEIREFWGSHYVGYDGAVWVAGRAISAREGARTQFDAIVDGKYRWFASGGALASTVEIDGLELRSGEEVELAKGLHQVALRNGTAGGVIALGLADPPTATRGPFYGAAQIREITGRGYF